MVLLKFSVTIYPVYFRFLLCYNGQDERQKYRVIEDSNKKAERSYSPGNKLCIYSFFDNNPEIFVRIEIYAPKLFIVRVRTVPLWRRRRDLNPRYGLSHTTPLAGEPLRPLGYFSKFVRLCFAILLSEQLSLSVFACLYYHIFSLRSTVFAFLTKFFSFNLLLFPFYSSNRNFIVRLSTMPVDKNRSIVDH